MSLTKIRVFGVGDYTASIVYSLNKENIIKIVLSDAPCGFGLTEEEDNVKLFIGDQENFDHGLTRNIYCHEKDPLKLSNIIYNKIKPPLSSLKIRLFENPVNILTLYLDEFGCAFLNHFIDDKDHHDALEDDVINILVCAIPLSSQKRYSLAMDYIDMLRKIPQRQPYVDYQDPNFDITKQSDHRLVSLVFLFDFESMFLEKKGNILVKKNKDKEIKDVLQIGNNFDKIISKFILKLLDTKDFKEFVKKSSKKSHIITFKSLKEIRDFKRSFFKEKVSN